jgi:hypothetical protein
MESKQFLGKNKIAIMNFIGKEKCFCISLKSLGRVKSWVLNITDVGSIYEGQWINKDKNGNIIISNELPDKI